MRSFASRLAAAVQSAGSCLCVGLDPDPVRLPATLTAGAYGVADFCTTIVDATREVAAAYKPNLAFFEALGPDGWTALARVSAHVRASGHLLVLDGKRGDIGNTGRLYATALFDRLGADAATVAPYMGHDSLAPFLDHPGRAAFVLVETSNPGAGDVQALVAGGRRVSEHVASMSAAAGADAPGEVGFVVGATRPERLAALRAAHAEIPFLVPGVGAQGGDAWSVLDANAGGPILVNVGRDILYASAGTDWAEAAADAARSHADVLAM